MQGNQRTKNIKSRLSLLLCLATLLPGLSLWAQNEVLLVRGLLKDEETLKKLESVQVIIFQNGNQFDTYEAGTSGKFSLEVPLGYSYDFKFSREGYVAKILRFDTRNIPPEDKTGGFQIDVDMKLFPLVEGFNADILKEPIGSASFSDQENNILFDFKYTERMQAKVKAEFDRLKKLSQEGDKVKIEFDKLMQEGTQKMIEEKYQDAMGKFEGALKLFPKDGPAKQKYDEAKAKYDALLAAQKKDADYLKLIAEGDSYFNSKKWAEAKTSFKNASNLKKDEKYPKEKLYEIDKMIEQEALYAEYQVIIKDADGRFNNKDYALAIERYRDASKKIPSESYPKDQIAKAQAALDELLSDEAKRQQLEKRYQDMIELGDRNMSEKNYESAKVNFEEALSLKANEKYPKDKIEEIDRILKDLKKKEESAAASASNEEKERIDREYSQHIQAGDKFYSTSKEKDIAALESSLTEYQAAADLKPSEKYPQAKIKSIGEILERLKADQTASSETHDKNAQRLKQEEEMKRKREEMERLAEEQRQALNAEEQKRLKEKQDALAAAAEEKKKSGSFLKVDNSEEQAVDEYYRRAREIEYEAKWKAVKEKEEFYAQSNSNQRQKASDLMAERIDNIGSQKDQLTSIYRSGNSWQAKSESELTELREQDVRNQDQYARQAEQREKRSEEQIEGKKEVLETLPGNDRNRLAEIEALKNKQENYEESSALNKSKGEAILAANAAAVGRSQEAVAEMTKDGEKVRQANIEVAETKKSDNQSQQKDVCAAAEVRLQAAESKMEFEKEKAVNVGKGKEDLQEQGIMEVNEKKQITSVMNMEKETNAAASRAKTREELFNLNPGREKTADEYHASPESDVLPEGVTENSYEYAKPSRKVIERIVRRGNRVDKYRKEVSKTGIFYFKNDKSITEEMWIRETLKATE